MKPDGKQILKRCSKCGRKKSASDFYARACTADRLMYWCKNCELERQASRSADPAPAGFFKTCRGKCRRRLPASTEFFRSHRIGQFGLDSRCLECRRAEAQKPAKKRLRSRYVRAYRRKNAVKFREYMLRSQYGMTAADYEKKYQDQDGLCKICREPYEVLHVDHNHKTGQIRDLLCGNCNRAIGIAQEDAARLRALADYVERHSRNGGAS